MQTKALRTLAVYYAPPFPPPYSYYYTLTIQWQSSGLSVTYDLEYTNREELSEEEILAEGFTLDDDYHWQGTLSEVWREVLERMIEDTTTLNDQPVEVSEALLELTLQYAAQQQEGRPNNASAWDYCLQELIQAIYEASKKERPLEIRYLNIAKADSLLVHFQASFLHRRLTVKTVLPRENTRTIHWDQLQPLLQAVYTPDYDPEGSSTERPQQPGRYIDPGDGYWYLLGQQVTNPGNRDVIKTLNDIIYNLLS